MCIVIDTCTLSRVFCKTDKEHEQYKPVKDFVYHKIGKIVYGGTHYCNELKKAPSYLKLIGELEKINKTILLPCRDVDIKEKELQAMYPIEKFDEFDDPHIIALILLSKSRLLCTSDSRMSNFIKKSDISSKFRALKNLKIYKNKNNSSFLCSRNVPDEYKNKTKGKNVLKRKLPGFIKL